MNKRDLKQLFEDSLWEAVATEIEQNQMRKGLWLKALVDTENNQEKAKTIYAKLRVRQLERELRVEAEIAELEAEPLGLSEIELQMKINEALRKAQDSPGWLGPKKA